MKIILISVGKTKEENYARMIGEFEKRISVFAELEEKTRNIKSNKRITVALMGCAVNGPGEARHADIGVACGDKEGLLFRKGEIIRKIPEELIVPTLIEEIKEILNANA